MFSNHGVILPLLHDTAPLACEAPAVFGRKAARLLPGTPPAALCFDRDKPITMKAMTVASMNKTRIGSQGSNASGMISASCSTAYTLLLRIFS